MKNALNTSSLAKKFAALFMFVMSFALITNAANASKRVALVIGNSAYENATPLKNPRNDAEDLATKLIELGFEVVSGFDLKSRDLRDKVREFGQKLNGADVAMFFYAGHALQVNGRNYLAPVDTDIRNEGDLDFETIPMDFVERQMERETKTVLLFLDACRDNPLARNLTKSSRSTGGTRGLARENVSAKGTFIAFSTQPDNVALDGDGRNSPFTTALLKNIGRSNVEISTMMTDVRQQVYKATNEQQLPWTNSSLLGHFYFQGGEESKQVASLDDNKTPAVERPKPAVTAPIVQTETKSNDSLLSMRLEKLAWESVKDSTDEDVLSAFIKSYGKGFFGDLARLRLVKIKKNKTVATKPPIATKPVEVASLDNTEHSRKIQVEKVIRDEPQAAPAPKVVTREITRQIQAELNRVGCNLGRADGLWGAKSTRALNKFSQHAKVRLATLRPTYDLLDRLHGFKGRICPAPVVVAPPRAPKVRKQQVKTCQPGQKLSRKGNCYWPRTKQVKTCQPGQRLSRKGNCYWPRQKVARQPQPQPQPQPRVIVRQPQPQVIVRQPAPRRNNGLLGGAISGAIGSVIVNCGILNNC